MKKKYYKTARRAAWLMTLSLVLATVPTYTYAEEPGYEEGMGMVDESAAYSSVLVITGFPEFEKDEDGNFIDPDMQEKYANKTVLTGTSADALDLPDDLTVSGYVESEGPDALTEVKLPDMVWKLKSDTGETYSESSPAGTYTFVPDLDMYMEVQIAQETALFDELKLAEEVKLPKLNITVADPEAEQSTEMELYVETDAPAETELYEETNPPMETELYMETNPPAETELYEETNPPMETELYMETNPPAETEPYAETTSPTETNAPAETDIFSNMDDSLINAEGNIEFTSESENPVNTIDTMTENTAPVFAPAALTDLNVKITLTDGSGQTFSYPADNTVILLKAAPAEGENVASIVLPCNSTLDMTNLTVTFTDQAAENPATLNVILPEGANSWNLSGGMAQAMQITNPAVTDGSYYSFSLVVTRAFHTPGAAATCTTPQTCTVCGAVLAEATGHTPGPAATCTTPQTCTVCGAVLAEATGHTPGPAATCTTPQTCTVCGAVLAEATGHTPGPAATCTTPQTCTVCGAVLAKALGHNWKAATCTKPKTCARCNATEGAALGHLLYEDWKTVSTSTDSQHGEEIRYCAREGCDYSETRALNIIGNPANNVISGLANGASYELNKVLSFTASGAGMANTNPIAGDERYVPISWMVQNTPGSFRDNYTGSFSITQPGSYTLTVSFQRQRYSDGWKVTDTVDNKSITFSVGGSTTAAPTDGIRINPQTGDDTPIMALVIALIAAAAVIIAVVFFRKKKK